MTLESGAAWGGSVPCVAKKFRREAASVRDYSAAEADSRSSTFFSTA